MNEIILSRQTPSHKNSKQVFMNSRTGKRFPANNNRYLSWKNGAIAEAKNQLKFPIKTPVVLVVTFFTGDKRKRDLDNMVASVQDILVESGVIADDNIFEMPILNANFGGIDRENPRAEIKIIPLECAEKCIEIILNIVNKVIK